MTEQQATERQISYIRDLVQQLTDWDLNDQAALNRKTDFYAVWCVKGMTTGNAGDYEEQWLKFVEFTTAKFSQMPTTQAAASEMIDALKAGTLKPLAREFYGMPAKKMN